MKINSLQSFKSHRLRSLFFEEREEWWRQLYWDYGEPQRLIAAMIDAGSLPGFVALRNGDPVAYAFYVETAGKGLLCGCFASAAAEGENAEELLLEKSTMVLKEAPAIYRIESQFINLRQWPITRFFAQQRFNQFGRCFMVRDCRQELSTRQLIEADLHRSNLRDLAEMAKLTVDAYASVIDRVVTYHYQSLSDCQEFLTNLVFRPGCGNFLPEASYCARDVRTNELMGYVIASRISPQDGHIPQIAVAPAHQGKGLGAELLTRVIRYLSLNGYQRVSLTVTETNLPAITLYQRFGFSVHFRFPAFVWLRHGSPE